MPVVKRSILSYVVCLPFIYMSVLFGRSVVETAGIMNLATDASPLAYFGLIVMFLIPLVIIASSGFAFYKFTKSKYNSVAERKRAVFRFTGVMCAALFLCLILSQSGLYYLPLDLIDSAAGKVVVTLRPESLKERQDSLRFDALREFNNHMSGYYRAHAKEMIGQPQTLYISVPDTSPTCANIGLPPLEEGFSYHCVPGTDSLKSDGSGWLPIDWSKEEYDLMRARLPVDPVNTVESGYYYTYITNAQAEWELHGKFASQDFINDSNLRYRPERTNNAPFFIIDGPNITLKWTPYIKGK